MVYRHYYNTLSTVPLDADGGDAADIPDRRTDGCAMICPRSRSSIIILFGLVRTQNNAGQTTYAISRILDGRSKNV
jgi:hypothetical protein